MRRELPWVAVADLLLVPGFPRYPKRKGSSPTRRGTHAVVYISTMLRLKIPQPHTHHLYEEAVVIIADRLESRGYLAQLQPCHQEFHSIVLHDFVCAHTYIPDEKAQASDFQIVHSNAGATAHLKRKSHNRRVSPCYAKSDMDILSHEGPRIQNCTGSRFCRAKEYDSITSFMDL